MAPHFKLIASVRQVGGVDLPDKVILAVDHGLGGDRSFFP